MTFQERAEIHAFVDRLIGSELEFETLIRGYSQIDAHRASHPLRDLRPKVRPSRAKGKGNGNPDAT
jgi:hypothetical protein